MEEEEIIVPEEVFDLKKLRYILNNDGYVCHASIGGLIVCDLGECTEYNGDVPDGYETIEEWYDEEIERLNRDIEIGLADKANGNHRNGHEVMKDLISKYE